jgi:hypothetical protein
MGLDESLTVSKKIFSSVFNSMQADSRRTFVVENLGMFRTFVDTLDKKKLVELKTMISDGRLEIMGQRIASSDSSVTYFEDLNSN